MTSQAAIFARQRNHDKDLGLESNSDRGVKFTFTIPEAKEKMFKPSLTKNLDVSISQISAHTVMAIEFQSQEIKDLSENATF